MRGGQGTNTYRWVGDWAELPDTESVHKGWAHHGVVVTESGDVVTFRHQHARIRTPGHANSGLKPCKNRLKTG